MPPTKSVEEICAAIERYQLMSSKDLATMKARWFRPDRKDAIEVLSAKSAADKAVLTEFQQAALKATKLQHPNVGRILDTGEAHGFYYLVKEYYEGQTIEDILERRGKLPYEHATRFMALALAGLEALHAHGVPAGDLTADCLLLAPVSADQPNQRTVKILHAGVK